MFYGNTAASGSLYDTARYGSNAALIESISAQLKLKEGELVQMQVLLSEQSKVKESMTKELTRLTIIADEVHCRIHLMFNIIFNVLLQNEVLKTEIAQLKDQLSEVQQKYNTMLTVSIKVGPTTISFENLL